MGSKPKTSQSGCCNFCFQTVKKGKYVFVILSFHMPRTKDNKPVSFLHDVGVLCLYLHCDSKSQLHRYGVCGIVARFRAFYFDNFVLMVT